MNIPAWTKFSVAVILAIGLLILCVERIIPGEAYCAIAGAALTYVVEEWRIERIMKR
jgi:hypothetical protein